jgi:hypothetical protein
LDELSPRVEKAIAPLRRYVTPAIVPRLRACAVIELDGGLGHRELTFPRLLAVAFVDARRRSLAYFVAPKADWPPQGTKQHGEIAAVPTLGLGGGLSPRCVVEEVMAQTRGLQLVSRSAESANRWCAELLIAAGYRGPRTPIIRLDQAFHLSEVDRWHYLMALEAVSSNYYHSKSAVGAADSSAEFLRILAGITEAHGPPMPLGSREAHLALEPVRTNREGASASPPRPRGKPKT